MEKTPLNKHSKEWKVELFVNGTPVCFKIGTDADVSIMSEDAYRKLQDKHPLNNMGPERVASPGGQVVTLGQFTASVKFKDKQYSTRLFVTGQWQNN